MGSLWNDISYRKRQILVRFGMGINQYNDPLDLQNEELTDAWNMCSDDYPIIRTRNDRVLIPLPQSTNTLYVLNSAGIYCILIQVYFIVS